MARRRKGRDISGILVLNKPLGITSNQALQQVKRLLGAAKAGHTGALDPMASGVLPLCFGEATKFSQILLESTKGYITTAKLGEVRTTGDQEGEVIATKPVPEFDEALVESVLEKFRGEITQVPPMYSALKHEGKPLYELAREGKEIDLAAIKQRQVTIHSLKLLEIRPEVGEIDLEVICSKGTYIRSLVEDIGNDIGCGAYVSMLHRIKAGPFNEADMLSLDDLKALAEEARSTAGEEADGDAAQHAALDPKLHHPAAAIPDWPRIDLTQAQGKQILHGQRVKTGFPENTQVQLWVDTSDEPVFIGVGDISATGVVSPKRLLQVTLD